ncbi:hypothetical protein POM88_024055 [Heracleum sosnowskyi]|uniref:Uncharacterized protein n=1 Tax=Heracleum sosnowskyi TaxID=360622 RepID=A0AAD8ILV8_9APIA|nr:hypothetical protein POM88_024055 [Heracleum sosnowskyi]
MGLFSIFRSTRTRRGKDISGTDDFVKSYKVYRSDEDRGRWVAEPGIDRKASAYIEKSQRNWNLAEKRSFGLFSIFKSTRTPRGRDMCETDDFVKSYKVYRSDEDRGRWVAEPGIDWKASAYIARSQRNWNLADVSN